MAPKEKSELEKAKEEAERRAAEKKKEEEDGNQGSNAKEKTGKKVGFASTSRGAFATG